MNRATPRATPLLPVPPAACHPPPAYPRGVARHRATPLLGGRHRQRHLPHCNPLPGAPTRRPENAIHGALVQHLLRRGALGALWCHPSERYGEPVGLDVALCILEARDLPKGRAQ
jgi:hypothetical protein